MARAEYCLEVIEQDPIDLRVPCQRPVSFQSGEYIPTTAGGTKDYERLINKPSIENVTLIGNKTFDELGMSSLSNMEIEHLLT